MKHRNSLLVVETHTPKSSTPLVRRLIWLTLFITGVMMITVLLSHPSAVAFVKSNMKRAEVTLDSIKPSEASTQQIAKQFLDNITNTKTQVEASDQSTLDQVAADNAEARQKYGVSNMPTSRVPVNRFGTFTKN